MTGPSLPRAATMTTLLLLALATVAIGWPWLTGAVTIPYDAKSQFYPQQIFMGRALAEGTSPFWTPNVFAGWPQIADPQSLIFSPLHFLLALIDPRAGLIAFDAVTFAMLFLGGAAIVLFFRDRGWHMGGAIVAALAFAFGGSCASRIQHTGQIVSIVFFALALWMLARTLTRPTWLNALATGVFAGFLAIGRDQVALLSLYVLAAYVLTHWFAGQGRAGRIRASLGMLVAAGIVAFAVAIVPIALTALLAADSNRPEIGFAMAGRGSLHPADLMMLAFSNLYGSSDWNRDLWGPPSFVWHAVWGDTDLYNAQNVGQIYAGALAFVAVIGLGIVRGALWSREIRFFAIALAVALLYALGKYTPAFRVMYELMPGVALFRRPADATFVFGYLYAVCAGYTVHRWIDGTIAPMTRAQIVVCALIALVLVAGAVALALSVGMLAQSAGPILIGVGAAIAAIAVLWIARQVAKWPVVAAALLAAFSAADLAFHHAPNESSGLAPGFYDALPPNSRDDNVTLLRRKLAETAAPDRRDRVELIGIAYHWPNAGLIHDFDHLFGHNPLRLKDFAAATGVGDTVAGPDQRTFAPLFPSYRSVMADLFGVRFIATGVPVEEIDRSLKPGDLTFVARTRDAYVYENPRALPRVLVVGRWRKADFAQMIRDGKWPDGFDPRREVLLERPPQGFEEKAESGGTARLVRYRTTEIVIEAEAPAGGILVLNDVWHPWWRAAVDAREVEILKANVLFRAVVLPPGKHLVRFEFRPLAGALAQARSRLRL